MKFIPQLITCTHCNHQGQIITEDIPLKDLVLQLNQEGKAEIIAFVECPKCHVISQIIFVHRRDAGNETLFECIIPPNNGLQMWRWIVNGVPKMPVFQPEEGGRSQCESILDSHCRDVVDHLLEWKNQPQPGQELADLLGEVQDYTKTTSWRAFSKRHFIVNICAKNDSHSFYLGFSGIFSVVKRKNSQLMSAFQHKLGGCAEDKSKQFCKNLIGHCAEMHAANKCMNYESPISLSDLRFSIAYVYRTGMPRSYCMNCITVFSVRNG